MNVTRPVVNCITRGRAPPAAGSINLERQWSSLFGHLLQFLQCFHLNARREITSSKQQEELSRNLCVDGFVSDVGLLVHGFDVGHVLEILLPCIGGGWSPKRGEEQ